MKARATIVLVLVISLAIVPLLAAVPARAQTGYTERLDVYTAGGSAFWTITMDKLGVTLPAINSAESTSGLTSFRLVAESQQGATSDLQVFGVNGYNPLQLPTAPSDGLFLTVQASSASTESQVASVFASLFGTTFTQVSSTGDSVTYFAPADFINMALPILYSLVPTSAGGFASFASLSTLETLPTPFLEVVGTNTGSGFDNSVVMGAGATGAITTTGVLNLSELIGSSNATLAASSTSTSSEVAIHSLDGVIVSSDQATVLNHEANASGSYFLSVPAGKEVKVNATLETQPPVALAYRLLDQGNPGDGGLVDVSVVISDTAKTGTIQNVTLNDDWWQSYPGVFQLTSGTDSVTIPDIGPGQNQTESYVLKVISSTPSLITIPASDITFVYQLSTGTFSGRAVLGQQVIAVNEVEPSLSVVAHANVQSGSPIGTAGDYVVTLTNVGNSTARDVFVGGQSAGSIVQNGGTATVEIPVTLTTLADWNLTSSFPVTYVNTAGTSINSTSNPVQLLLSHTGMLIPFVQVTTNDTVTASALQAKTMNVTYTFANDGKGTPTSIDAIEDFPQGVTCLRASAIGTCTGSAYSVAVSSLASKQNDLNLTFGADNYIVQPTTVTATFQGMQLKTWGGTYVIPAGVVVTKSFGPDTGFPGTSSTVTLSISNVGSSPIINATLASGYDSFDTSSNSSQTTEKTYPEIAAGDSETFSYGVTIVASAYGNLTGAAATAGFVFAGSAQDISEGNGHVTVYEPVTATVTSNPSSPEENHDFTLQVTLTNAAPVAVSDVVYTLTLPTGVSLLSGGTLSGHTVTVTIPSMQPSSNQNVSLRMTSNGGLTIDTSKYKLTFEYLGQTLSGVSSGGSVVVTVDLTTRYTLPIVIAVLVGVVAVVVVRRRVVPVAKP